MLLMVSHNNARNVRSLSETGVSRWRSIVALWFTCFEDVQRKTLLSTSWLCNIQDISIDAQFIQRLLRQWFECFPWGNFFISCFMEHLPRLQGSYSIHLWKFPWYGVWVLWTDDIIPVVGLEHLEISQGLFQVVLVLKTLDISLDWHRSNTNQLLRIVHKKLSYFQDHIPTEPQSFFPRKKKQSGRRLGKISIPSVTWFLRFCASFMEFFTSLESWCWIWCPPQTWKAVLSLVYCWI